MTILLFSHPRVIYILLNNHITRGTTIGVEAIYRGYLLGHAVDIFDAIHGSVVDMRDNEARLYS